MSSLKKVRVIHIITGLEVGGAETALFKLLSTSDTSKYQIEVISLTGEGSYGTRIREMGFKLYCLNLKLNPFSFISTVIKVTRNVKQADTLFCWMYHANLVGILSGRLARIKNIIWNIRHSNLDKDKNRKSTLFIIKFSAWLGKFVTTIVYNSQQARTIHLKAGYPSKNSVVLPNGFDLHKFRPIPEARESIRKSLKINEGVKFIVSVSRWDPQKDIPNLVKAITKLNEHVVLGLCGKGLSEDNKELRSLIDKLSLSSRVRLMGICQNLPEILSASDLFVLPSAGESFPNALGEAMACGTLCIATDVGDCAAILGDAGWIVPPHDVQALSNAITKALTIPDEQRRIFKAMARKQIQDKYNLEAITPQYEALYISDKTEK